MAIALRGVSAITTGSSGVLSTATAANPGSATALDFCLIWMVSNSATKTFSCPTFNPAPVIQGNNLSIQLLYKVLDGLEVWPITISCSAVQTFCGQLICYSGVGDGQPYDPRVPTSGQTNAASTSVTPPSITTINTNDQIVWFGADRSTAAGGVPPTITIPAGSSPTFTTRSGQTNTSNGANSNVGSIVCDGSWTGSGAIQPVGTITSAISAAVVLGLNVGIAPVFIRNLDTEPNQALKRSIYY